MAERVSKVGVGIVGPTGYTGLELIELIMRHPAIEIAYLASARTPAPAIDEEFPRLKGRLPRERVGCEAIDSGRIAERCKLVFLCLPHEAAMEQTPGLLAAGVKVVDLSAAYRLREAETYESAYGHAHTDVENLAGAVYGLTEFARERVRGARLVANPGCYPTAAAIALVPLLRAGLIRANSIVINAASGVSGAGRSPKANLHFPEANENYSPYGIGTHRHQPEIGQSLRRWGIPPFGEDLIAPGIEGCDDPLFVPHLLPIERGILETIYALPVSDGLKTSQLQEALCEAYRDEPFVVVRDGDPTITLRDVQRTNRVHVNARIVCPRAGRAGREEPRVVVIAAEDNLVKGASGQAVQNANLMLGLEESLGLV
ncbi:MAG: N-acetyl-gamma-glutamyl-phosphate reductase [Phycisphaeraceae bacterium]|nr:N-acetyl-gamma-glutamyl-phosphate reductase [Phycisphaeraceae bacterium]